MFGEISTIECSYYNSINKKTVLTIPHKGVKYYRSTPYVLYQLYTTFLSGNVLSIWIIMFIPKTLYMCGRIGRLWPLVHRLSSLFSRCTYDWSSWPSFAPCSWARLSAKCHSRTAALIAPHTILAGIINSLLFAISWQFQALPFLVRALLCSVLVLIFAQFCCCVWSSSCLLLFPLLSPSSHQICRLTAHP